LVAAWAEK